MIFPFAIVVAVTGPETTPARLPVIVVALPFKFAVMVPALKFPEASRATIAFAVLLLSAEVALFATFPDVTIVANFLSLNFRIAETNAGSNHTRNFFYVFWGFTKFIFGVPCMLKYFKAINI